MGNFLTCAFLLERYGLRLDIKQLAQVLQVSESNIINKLAEKRFPIPAYRDGKVWFDYRDVADYMDKKREEAARELGAISHA